MTREGFLAALTSLGAAGLLAPLSVQLTRLVARLEPDAGPGTLMGVCLTSHRADAGDACVDLEHWCGREPWAEGGPGLPRAPDLVPWVTELRGSTSVAVVGNLGDLPAGERRPLVLDGSRLYLYRYWACERAVAELLRERAGRRAAGVDVDALRRALPELFPTAGSGDVNWQKVAAAVAVLRGLCVVCGGPGTGKTTTVVGILALLGGEPGGGVRSIGLAAPTGKAAARVQEAVRHAKQASPLNARALEAVPEEALTVHRLLGWRSDGGFGHDARNPLDLDVLVLDEASMLDLAMATRLLQALKPETRLILMGDRDQLASVEAGSVLADICAPEARMSASFSREVGALTGEALPAADGDGSALGDCVVTLRRSHRFGAHSGIGRLARAVNDGVPDVVQRVLRDPDLSDVDWEEGADPDALIRCVLAGYGSYLDLVRAGADAGALLEALDRYRVLCAHAAGPRGATGVNALMEDELLRRRLARARDPWYHGRPIMVVRNDYAARLFNGDVGVAVRTEDPDDSGARYRVAFPAEGGAPRLVPVAWLPEHVSMYATTVHKSQGSEFDDVLVVLPTIVTAVLSRELLYTAVTRARRRVRVMAPADVLRAAVSVPVQRASGLAARLWNSAPGLKNA